MFSTQKPKCNLEIEKEISRMWKIKEVMWWIIELIIWSSGPAGFLCASLFSLWNSFRWCKAPRSNHPPFLICTSVTWAPTWSHGRCECLTITGTEVWPAKTVQLSHWSSEYVESVERPLSLEHLITHRWVSDESVQKTPWHFRFVQCCHLRIDQQFANLVKPQHTFTVILFTGC